MHVKRNDVPLTPAHTMLRATRRFGCMSKLHLFVGKMCSKARAVLSSTDSVVKHDIGLITLCNQEVVLH
jgi:hypothetical protein